MPDALSVRWVIFGDDNGAATVEVAYRSAAESNWRRGLPLFWVHPENAANNLRVEGGRIFAGSIVDLEPGTEYEVRVDLIDLDGGSEKRTMLLEITHEPNEPRDVRVVHLESTSQSVAPGSGTRDDPYSDLAAALETAGPGDLLLLQGGRYETGQLRLKNSGRAGKPIIIKGASVDQAVSLMARGWPHCSISPA